MKRVLYIGNYKSGTGWGNAAQGNILALDAAGVEVVPRNINVAGTNGEVPARILELEKRSTVGCDILIQHVLPPMMEYSGRFEKCIGIFESETSSFRASGWNSYLDLMDEVWVVNQQMVDACQASHVTKPIHIVPHACDVAKYTKRYPVYPLPETKNNFNFYTLGELTRRKNLVALLKALHTEFHPSEPVNMLIKANLPGKSPMECYKHLSAIIEEVKRELKLYDISKYRNEVIIMQHLTNEEVMKLHATGDCFVMPSFGEAWNIPAFDAMGLGKTPICTDFGGTHDFMTVKDKVAGWLVPGSMTPAFGTSQQTLPRLYCGDEDWMDVSIPALRKAMREAFENKELREEKAALGIDRAYDFCYEAVGQQMKTLLEQ